ncbi:MAG TPA: PHP domain-containing protein, partial [Actinomycetes bacterium]|nr:PHP domain-containing protein [Actinomycetes bacterium]
MGWQNPPLPWSELERRLAGRPPPAGRPSSAGRPPPAGRPSSAGRPPPVGRPPGAAGGDAPAWSSKRQPYRPPPPRISGRLVVSYAELHCHSNASFLDGGSHPEELAEEAARLRLEALAITDHDGFYGVVRFAEAARSVGMPTVFGSELSLGLTKPQNG